MNFNHLTRGHLMVISGELALACSHVARCIDDPDRQHLIPGAVREASDALNQIAHIASGADPAIGRAITQGARSTRDLRHPAEASPA